MKASQICNRENIIDTQLDSLMDERECARITGRSVASLRRDRLLKKGFPFVKLQHQVKYRPEDVRKHIERNLHCGEGR
jgi:hypothetical protein